MSSANVFHGFHARQAALLVMIVMGVAACTKSGSMNQPRKASTASHLTKAPPVSLTHDEENIMTALRDFYAALGGALRSPQARSVAPSEMAKAIKRFSDPALERFTLLSAVYNAMGQERRKVIQREFIFRNITMLQGFMQAVADWCEQFKQNSRTAYFRPVVRQVLQEWHERGAMWVFSIWSEEAVEELTEWAVSGEDHRERPSSLSTEPRGTDRAG